MKKRNWEKTFAAIRIAWPSILENLTITITGMIDTIMVSSLGSAAVAAVGLTTQPKFLFLTPFIATNVAVSALVARRKGAEDRQGANKTFLTAIKIVSLIYLAIAILALFFSDPILRFVGSNPDTHDSSSTYFKIVLIGAIFNIWGMTINSAHSGSGNTRIAFVSNLVSSIVNILFNYLLIGGKFGFPALGTAGAAIATVIGQAAGFGISFGSLLNNDNYVSIQFIRRFKVKAGGGAISSIASLSTNIALENFFMRIGFIVTAMWAAGLGTDVFAAHNVGMNLLSFGFALANGMQTATVALTGSALGAEDKKLALDYGKVCVNLGYVLSLIWAVSLVFLGETFYKLHFDDAKVIKIGVRISWYVIVIVFLQIQQIIYAGSLRAAGDVKYTLVASTISVTIIRSLMTIGLVSGLGLGINGIWLGILSDQITRFLLLGHRFHQGKWVDLKI